MRIVHILPHNIEDFIATGYDSFDHHSVRFIERIRKFYELARPDEPLTQELWVLTRKNGRALEVMHRSGFLVRLFPISVRLRLPLEVSFPMVRFLAQAAGTKESEHTLYHLHGYYLFMHDLLAPVLAWHGRKFLIHYRGGGPSWTWKATPYTLYHYGVGLRMDLNLSEKAVIQNYDELRRAKNLLWVPPSKLLYMPNSVAASLVPAAPERHDATTIVMAGRTEKLKNKEELAKALAATLAKHAGSRMEFIGTKGEDPMLATLRADFPGRITIVPWVSKAELSERFKKTDIFLHTNTKQTYEGSPMTLIEAQSMGNAAVVFDIEGVRDVVTTMKNGILVRDYAGLEAALDALVGDKGLREKMRENALATVRERFTDERYFPVLIDLYRHLAAQS